MSKLPQPSSLGFKDTDELTLLACLVGGEARGESRLGKIAVGWVVRNRVESGAVGWFGGGYPGVILKPFQFSAFNENDPNAQKMLDPIRFFGEEVWKECYAAAAAVYFDFEKDPTRGADHYHTKDIATPAWAKVTAITVKIGNHIFYKLRQVA